MQGPATGRDLRVSVLHAVLPCLALIASSAAPAAAQTLTSDLLRPVRDGLVLPQDSPLRRTAQAGPDDPNRLRDADAPAPSRIGNIPTFGQPAASGASGSGYDSLNRKRQKQKLFPGQPKPKVAGPGNRPPTAALVTRSVAPPRNCAPNTGH